MEVLEYGNKDSQVVLIQLADAHDIEMMEDELATIRERADRDFLLRVFKVEHWNEDLSPWEAPPVFGKEGFGAGAEKTLAEVMSSCADRDRKYYIGGYSLAGLFALWSVYQTDLFSGAAAASPSIWFPGFTDYMREHEVKTGCVYLSLGDREAKARNPVMATVAKKIQEAYDLLQSRGVTSTLEWNAGNHFRESDVRTAKAFSWVMTTPED